MLTIIHPTKVVLIEDDAAQLDALKTVFSREFKLVECFSDGDLASRWIKNKKNQGSRFYSPCKVGRGGEIQFEKSEIERLIKDQDKYQNVSVVIADYQLNSDITGLDVLSGMQDKNIYKVLYTGIADEGLAVEAFNQGKINAFFKKSKPIGDLIDLILKGQHHFWTQVGRPIISLLENKAGADTALLDEDFHLFVEQVLLRHKIEECYLIDEYGSYFMLDEHRSCLTLLVMPINTVLAQIELLSSEGLANVANEVLDRKKMVYINNGIEPQASYTEFIFPCTLVGRKKKFMVALVKQNVLKFLI